MAFKRTFAPALINASNVKALSNDSSLPIEDGTAKLNEIDISGMIFHLNCHGSLVGYSHDTSLCSLRQRELNSRMRHFACESETSDLDVHLIYL